MLDGSLFLGIDLPHAMEVCLQGVLVISVLDVILELLKACVKSGFGSMTSSMLIVPFKGMAFLGLLHPSSWARPVKKFAQV